MGTFVSATLSHGALCVFFAMICLNHLCMCSFGERQCYKSSASLAVISKLLKKLFNVGVPLIKGRWCSLLPFARPFLIVVGKPIPVQQSDAVSEEEVERLMDAYCNEIRVIYDSFKQEMGYGNIELKIV